MGLYFDDIFTINKAKVPGRIIMNIPVLDDTAGSPLNKVTLYGLLISEPSIRGSNKWAPIISDVSNLTDLSSFMSMDALFSWIGASTLCWKGTDPLKFNLDFYMINYKPELDLEGQLEALMKLTSLNKSNALMVKVHGGYTPDVLLNNNQVFDASMDSIRSDINSLNVKGRGRSIGTGEEKGTVSISIGQRMNIKNLLVSSAEVVPSIVEVCDPDGNNIKPLYYRVSVALIGVNPLLSTEVPGFFYE